MREELSGRSLGSKSPFYRLRIKIAVLRHEFAFLKSQITDDSFQKLRFKSDK